MTPPRAAVLLTGNELLRGVIADRNAAHLAERLERLGMRMARVLVVGDEVPDIEAGLRELLEAADLVVTSGGLGPTHDDRTVEAHGIDAVGTNSSPILAFSPAFRSLLQPSCLERPPFA